MNIDQKALADIPKIIESGNDSITIAQRWSVQAVYEAAEEHCAARGRRSFPVSAPPETDHYKFVCE